MLDLVVGDVSVATTDNKGLDVDYWTERCMNKVMSVSNYAAGPIRDQAIAYENDIRKVINHYMQQAVQSDRTNVYNLLVKHGSADVAEHIRRL